jgi:D-glycero-D-manno-heptose 1,7-bisphosphate phosphatase
MKKPAVFLDRDGVINRDRSDFVKSWAEFEFLPGVLDALQLLAATPYVIVVVSNQSAIGRGLVEMETVDEIHSRMLQAIQQAGGRLEAIYYCPHSPEVNCPCRKPKPGLLHQVAEELGLDLSRSYLVGDSVRDLAAARAAGVQPILVLTGHGTSALTDLRESGASEPLCFADLPAVAHWLTEVLHEQDHSWIK